MEQIRVLIVDDHQVIRLGLAAIFTNRNGFAVIGQAKNGGEAIRMARQLDPDVILMDLLMPDVDGLEAIINIKVNNPDARILVLTSYPKLDRIAAIMAAGASGYFLKDSGADELMQAIRSVYDGYLILSPTVTKIIGGIPAKLEPEILGVDRLTLREVEVLQGIIDGLTNQAIAYQLGISQTTVRSHVSNILGKLNVSNRTQAALVAKELDLI